MPVILPSVRRQLVTHHRPYPGVALAERLARGTPPLKVAALRQPLVSSRRLASPLPRLRGAPAACWLPRAHCLPVRGHQLRQPCPLAGNAGAQSFLKRRDVLARCLRDSAAGAVGGRLSIN